MPHTFSLFPKLPPEIRHQIWHNALHDNWAFATLRRDSRGLKLVGSGCQNVRQACHEAREVTQLTKTDIKGLEWVDFKRLLIYFRDESTDGRLMQRADISYQILPHIQHLVLNPAHWTRLYKTMDRVKRRCTSLKTLVIIAPWADTPPPTVYDYQLVHIPYQGFEPIFRDTPAEVDTMPLVDAIKRGEAANSDKYGIKLYQGLELCSTMEDPLDNPWARLQKRVHDTEQTCQEFLNGSPALCLIRTEELDPKKVFISWEYQHHTWISHEYPEHRKILLEQGM